jgi:diaminopimelate decarboxylase
MNQPYLPPIISNELGRQALDAAADRNLYARGARVPALYEIDGQPVSDLLKTYGSPLFVFSEHTLREKARTMRDAFRSRYPDTRFAWSYKTNYLSAICKVFHEEGWMAEVVSDFEYQKARKLGIEGKDIIFNGPFKPREILERAVRERALIQIDNWDELAVIEELTQDIGEPLDVGIRVWMDAGIRPLWSKFGFSLENGEAARAALRLAGNPRLRLHTLHTHIGTYILEPNAYRVAVTKLLGLREQIQTERGHRVPCINLGGGFPSESLLHGMTGPAQLAVPPIQAYAEAITEVLNRLPAAQRPQLRFESGRHLVDNAGYLATSVVAIKGLRRPGPPGVGLTARDYKEQLMLGEEARTSYVVDAGINLLYTAAWYQIEASPARSVDAPPMPSRLYGPLCMAIDVVRYSVDLPPLDVGDVLTLHPVGAYNTAQSMQFIDYRPAAVLIDMNGRPHVIRKREQLGDVEGPECLPEHLGGR